MQNIIRFVIVLAVAAFAASVNARTIRIPENRPVIAVDIPDSWEPERIDRGVGAEDPDGVISIFFEVAASERQMEKLIDESFAWLVEEHELRINQKSKSESTVTVGGIKSSAIYFNAKSKEYGPAKVGFVFTPIADRLLVITFWISEEEFNNRLDRIISKIFASVRPLR